MAPPPRDIVTPHNAIPSHAQSKAIKPEPGILSCNFTNFMRPPYCKIVPNRGALRALDMGDI